MELKTKFDINDIVEAKHDAGSPERFVYMEVMEITTQTCYAGAQIFYKCRVAQAEKMEYREKSREAGVPSTFKSIWVLGNLLSQQDGQMGWKTFREDEVFMLAPHKLKIIEEAKQRDLKP